ncbi:MAG: hypothetical protein ACXAC8_08550 [Candidatus Hodarchaeales archaeon]|jgi:hypothetical protein
MLKNNRSKGSTITEGLIVTLFEDDGPTNVYNSSQLDDNEAFNMAVKTLTAIGSDVPLEYGEIRSYGPMPTTKQPFLTIGFIFAIKAKESMDPRILRFGRIVVFWVITRSNTLIKYIGVLKQMIRRQLRHYRIKVDIDLRNMEVLRKIDEKLKMIETGVESFYISENNTIESFTNISYIPENAPIMLVDDSNKKLRVLLRGEISPSIKAKMLQIANDYKANIHKGAIYKIEIISELLIAQQLLSKAGIISQLDVGSQFKLRFSHKLTFEELDEYFDSYLAPKRNRIISQILHSIDNKIELNLSELSSRSGISLKSIKEFITNAINDGLIEKFRIEDERFFFSEKKD